MDSKQVYIRRYGSIHVQRAELLESNRSGGVVNILGKNGEVLSTRLVNDTEMFNSEQAALDDLHSALVVELSSCHFRLQQLRGNNSDGKMQTISDSEGNINSDGVVYSDNTEINPVKECEVLESV